MSTASRLLASLLLLSCPSFAQHIEVAAGYGKLLMGKTSVRMVDKLENSGIGFIHGARCHKWWQAGIAADIHRLKGKNMEVWETLSLSSLQSGIPTSNGNITVVYSNKANQDAVRYIIGTYIYGNATLHTGKRSYLYAGLTGGKLLNTRRSTGDLSITYYPHYTGWAYGAQAGYTAFITKHLGMTAEVALRKTNMALENHDRKPLPDAIKWQQPIYPVTLGLCYSF